MKMEILGRIRELGRNTSNVKGTSLQEDILSITFDTVLYQDAETNDGTPIRGLGEFFRENINLYQNNKNAFYEMVFDKYYRITEERYGQYFWMAELFTPFKKGSKDFDEWNDLFDNETLSEELDIHIKKQSDFIKLFYSYGFLTSIMSA